MTIYCKNELMTLPVPVHIEFDWSSVRNLYNTTLQKRERNEYTNVIMGNEGDPEYDFSHLGSLVYGDYLSINWGYLSGKLLNSRLPWLKTAREYFKGLDFCGVAWSKTHGNIKKHADIYKDSEVQKPQCKINYIVSSTDLTGVTKVYNPLDESIVQEYPSIPGKAFLLNVNYPHEMICSGEREVLQFKFFEEFSTVMNFFKDKPDLFLK